MQQNKNHQQQNQIEHYRRRMRLKPRQVAHLLGHKDSSIFSRLERSKQLPSLMNAFRLSIILRVPVEFLFAALYDNLRQHIRTEEERIAQPAQSVLF